MRIAIFADIHGNPYALRALLQSIKQSGPLDAIVAAGDLCMGGSDPAACVEMLRQENVLGVYGNTETYLFAPDKIPEDELHREMWPRIQPAAYWNREQLNQAQMAWLQSLPFEQRFSPTQDLADDLLMVHANPKDLLLMIYPAPEQQMKLWKEVRQPDDDPALVEALEDVRAAVVAFGHFHYTFQRRWRDLLLVDVGPSSMPTIDHDKRARYTILEWQHNDWQATHHWISYDVQKEIDALRDSDLPNKEDYIRALE